MAKFRTNHQKSSESSAGMIGRVGLFGLILALVYFLIGNGDGFFPESTEAPTQNDIDILMPEADKSSVVRHTYYNLSYNEKYEQANWVVYELQRDSLMKPWVSRTNDFRRDPYVSTGSAALEDYRRSGYDRGHMAPAGDMAYNYDAMSESFFLSNMSPQVHNFNTGIWRELEETTRDWAKKFRHLYIVTGPVLTKEPIDYIGDNDVAVPAEYFKVILDLSEPELKGIGYIMPNKVSYQSIDAYAMSIDEVEQRTGINFFPDLMDKDLEERLEAKFDADLWPINKRRFEMRKDSWNVN